MTPDQLDKTLQFGGRVTVELRLISWERIEVDARYFNAAEYGVRGEPASPHIEVLRRMLRRSHAPARTEVDDVL